jgi:hypothetical protein
LGAVFQHAQAVLAGNGQDGVHVGRLAIQVHRQDDTGSWGYGRFNQSRVDVVGALVGLYRHGGGAALAHGQPGGNVGVAGHDHFVARSHAHGAQCQVQRVEAVGHANGVFGFAVGGVFGFKGFHF